MRVVGKVGASVTPRNKVFAGAAASTLAVSLDVLYAYNLVGEVA